jgi:hypothetical protein
MTNPMTSLQAIQLEQEVGLFRTADNVAFADVQVNGHRETWPIRSKSFYQLLRRRSYEKTGKAPSARMLQSALDEFGAKAQFDVPERAVYVHVGGLEDQAELFSVIRN